MLDRLKILGWILFGWNPYKMVDYCMDKIDKTMTKVTVNINKQPEPKLVHKVGNFYTCNNHLMQLVEPSPGQIVAITIENGKRWHYIYKVMNVGDINPDEIYYIFAGHEYTYVPNVSISVS